MNKQENKYIGVLQTSYEQEQTGLNQNGLNQTGLNLNDFAKQNDLQRQESAVNNEKVNKLVAANLDNFLPVPSGHINVNDNINNNQNNQNNHLTLSDQNSYKNFFDTSNSVGSYTFDEKNGFRRDYKNKNKNFLTKNEIPSSKYICHRCGIGGHFIRDCPTNGDFKYDLTTPHKKHFKKDYKETNETKVSCPSCNFNFFVPRSQTQFKSRNFRNYEDKKQENRYWEKNNTRNDRSRSRSRSRNRSTYNSRNSSRNRPRNKSKSRSGSPRISMNRSHNFTPNFNQTIDNTKDAQSYNNPDVQSFNPDQANYLKPQLNFNQRLTDPSYPQPTFQHIYPHSHLQPLYQSNNPQLFVDPNQTQKTQLTHSIPSLTLPASFQLPIPVTIPVAPITHGNLSLQENFKPSNINPIDINPINSNSNSNSNINSNINSNSNSSVNFGQLIRELTTQITEQNNNAQNITK